MRTQALYEYSGDQLQDSNIPMAEGEVFEVVEEDTDGYGVDKTFRDVLRDLFKEIETTLSISQSNKLIQYCTVK